MGCTTRSSVSIPASALLSGSERQTAPMNPPNGAWSPPCPVCGRPSADAGAGPCRTCGLPAVGQAALVVARIGVTLTELARDRDALVATLRAAAPGAPAPAPLAPPAAPPVQPPVQWAPAPPPPPQPP